MGKTKATTNIIFSTHEMLTCSRVRFFFIVVDVQLFSTSISKKRQIVLRLNSFVLVTHIKQKRAHTHTQLHTKSIKHTQTHSIFISIEKKIEGRKLNWMQVWFVLLILLFSFRFISLLLRIFGKKNWLNWLNHPNGCRLNAFALNGF